MIFKRAPGSPYGIRVYCPICKNDFYLHSVKGHITNMAHREPFKKITGQIKTMPHFVFWKKNTVKVTNKYIWKI